MYGYIKVSENLDEILIELEINQGFTMMHGQPIIKIALGLFVTTPF
jgi:hypothetical protein